MLLLLLAAGRSVLRERRSTSQDLTTDADARRVNSLDSDRPRRIICPSFA